MQLQIPLELFRGLKLEKKDLLDIARRSQQPHVQLGHQFLSERDRVTLFEACQKRQDPSKDINRLKRQLRSLIEVQANPLSNKVKSVGALKEALILCLGKLPHYWVFLHNNELQHWLPYVVEGVSEDNGGRYSAPHIRLRLAAWQLGQRKEVTLDFYNRDLRGRNLSQILDASHVRLESEELLKEYRQRQETYETYHAQTGEQFVVNGWVQIRDTEGSWKPETYRLPENPDLPGVAVMDHRHNLKDTEEKRVADVSQWSEEGREVEMPLHPLVYAYDLTGHVEIIAHIADVKPYQYQDDIDRYLVIPQETRKLLEVLRHALRLKDRDVISGKAGGCLILLKGDPGLGKTLTAQVFAEQNHRPLYELQCSQLGISPPEVEENLRHALVRARRWNAVLLINEAEVYVRARADDIVQNAIVGVFLRLLENLNGLCFLTTNRGTTIDDAVSSRALVHLDYEYPEPKERKELFRIQSEVQKLDLSDAACGRFAEQHHLSGRDIRQLVKLVKLLAIQRGKPVTEEDLVWALKWRPNGDAKAGETRKE
jgi:SpoVK/Ycf46/Vps4 family AAA+-type ATPase